MGLFVVIPVFSFFLIFLLLLKISPLGLSGWRNSFLLACVVWGLVIVIGTELLSLGNLITFEGVLLFWIVIICVTGFCHGVILKNRRFSLPIYPKVLSFEETVILGGVVGIVFMVGLIALIAPPNNWDSMVSHMSRVVHWIQNKNISPYPTHAVWQFMYYPPFSEFVILHFQILSDSDRFANCVQYFSLMGCLLGVSLIAQEFGLNSRGQLFSSLIAVTIPMAILQATNTKADLVASFWLVCFVYFFLRLKSHFSWSLAVWMGVSLGLVLFTRIATCFFAFPFFLWFVFLICKTLRRKFWKPVFLIGGITFIINLGYFIRNVNVWGDPWGDPVIRKQWTSDLLNVSVLVSRVVRNLAVHFISPFKVISETMERVLGGIHAFLGIDIVDPRTTFEGARFGLGGYTFHEDYAGNFFHLVLVGICMMIFFISKKWKGNPILLGYFWAMTCGFLLLSIIIKWNPWMSRYQLPLFMLCSPWMASVLTGMKKMWVVTLMSVLLIFFSLPWIFNNQTRGIWQIQNIFNTPRRDQYFSASPGFEDSYLKTAEVIRKAGCFKIGLVLTRYYWEYPLWVLLKDTHHKFRWEHVNVKNPTAAFLSKDFNPSAIISDDHTDDEEMIVSGILYRRKARYPHLAVYIPDENKN